MVFSPAATLVLAISAVCASPTAAKDNPILRARLAQKIKEELAEHDSQATAWVSEKSVDRQKWSSGKLLGRKIRLASWTEQSKSWLWIDDPRSIEFELRKLELREGRVEFSVRGKAKARFRVWGRIPNLVKGSVGGTLQFDLEIDGAASVGPGRLEAAQITRLDGRLDDLRFNNQLGRPFDDLAKDALNDYLHDKNAKLRRSIERAINRVQF